MAFRALFAAVIFFNLHSAVWGQNDSKLLCNVKIDAVEKTWRAPGRSAFKLHTDPTLDKCKNNVWYSYNANSLTVFVFVHGLGANSVETWLDEGSQSYWPELVRSDSRFGNPSIFLAGYPTAITGDDPFSIRDAARSLYDTLTTPTKDGKPPILSPKTKNIVFIGHSMGGVVVRHMLTRRSDAFKDLALGLVLVASPTLGSKLADFGDAFLPIFGNNTSVAAKQLKWHSDFLSELHDDFLDLRNRSLLPHLKGTEIYEARFVVTGGNQVVVEKKSAVTYFGPNLISGSDHWTIAKPNKDKDQTAHTTLLAFYFQQMQPEIEAVSKLVKPKKIVLMDSYAEIYDRKNAQRGEMKSHVIKRDLVGVPADFLIEPVHDNWNDYQRIVDHRPDLVIIHRSALGSNENDLRNFLNFLLGNLPSTKVVVYGRGKWENFDQHVRSLVDFRHSNRVFGLHVKPRNLSLASFADKTTAAEISSLVQEKLAAP